MSGPGEEKLTINVQKETSSWTQHFYQPEKIIMCLCFGINEAMS